MKKSKVIIKHNNKPYVYSNKKVDISMSSAFNQKDKKEFKNNIKVLVKR